MLAEAQAMTSDVAGLIREFGQTPALLAERVDYDQTNDKVTARGHVSITDAKGEQAAGGLFGLDLSAAEVERGEAFVSGVIERSGEDGLARLLEGGAVLPTPAEVDAPGLWLERIALPELGQG